MRPLARVLCGKECQLDLSLPSIMGILNVTPDSFSDGGRYASLERAVEHGLRMRDEGAAILDIGGESTRPGSPAVSPEEELERVIPTIEALRAETDLPLSIDTNKAVVAREAVRAGASFINDISGLNFDPEMAGVAAASGAGLFLMHTRGRPAVMQMNTGYANLLEEVVQSLGRSVKAALDAGVDSRKIAIDPGIGFGKDAEGNLELLHHLDKFHRLNCPILLGTSRKNFIGRILGLDNPLDRLSGTLATVALGVSQGVQLFRVHDVRQARETALVAWAIRERMMP